MKNICILLLSCTVALASCEALGLDDDGYDEAMADVRARTADKEKEREGYLEMKALYQDSAKYYTGLIGTESTAGEQYKHDCLSNYYDRLSNAFEYKAQIAGYEGSKLIAEGSVVANEYEKSTLFAIQARFEWEWGTWNEKIPYLDALVRKYEANATVDIEKLGEESFFNEITASNMWDVVSANTYWKDMYQYLDPSHPSAKYPYNAYVFEQLQYYSEKRREIIAEYDRRYYEEIPAFLVEWRKEKEEARKKMSEEIKALEANGAKWGD
jgi:hypothetical protein